MASSPALWGCLALARSASRARWELAWLAAPLSPSTAAGQVPSCPACGGGSNSSSACSSGSRGRGTGAGPGSGADAAARPLLRTHWLLGRRGQLPSPAALPATLPTRLFHTNTAAGAAAASAPGADAQPPRVARGKAPRHARAATTAPPPLLPPPARAAKPSISGGKGPSSKPAAGKPGVPRAPDEDRARLDELLAEMLAPYDEAGGGPGPVEAAEAAGGRGEGERGGAAAARTLRVVGTYVGDRISASQLPAALERLRTEPLPGCSLVSIFPREGHTVVLLRAGGGGAAEAPEAAAGGKQRLMAVVVLDYGGVVFVNAPAHVQRGFMQGVVGSALLPPTDLFDRSARGSAAAHPGGKAADGLLETYHEEVQVIVVTAPAEGKHAGGVGGKRGYRSRYIRPAGDAHYISMWDSVNLENVARVLSQSSAIRYYDNLCEHVRSRYHGVLKLGPEAVNPGLVAFLLRRYKGLPLKELTALVYASSEIKVALLGRLGLKRPPAIAWESARHHAVWEVMAEEYKLDDRRDELLEKVQFVKQEAMDLQESHYNESAKRGEAVIIYLIATEIVLHITGDLASHTFYGALAAASRAASKAAAAAGWI